MYAPPSVTLLQPSAASQQSAVHLFADFHVLRLVLRFFMRASMKARS